LRALLRPQFLFDFDEILRTGFAPTNKMEFVWNDDPLTASSILPQMFLPHLLMDVEWEGSDTTVRRSEKVAYNSSKNVFQVTL